MRRSQVGLWVFLGVAVSLVGSVHWYFIRRLVLDTRLPEPAAGLLTAAIVGGGVLLFAHPIADRRFGSRVSRVSAWPAYLWLGACFYLLLGLAVSDLVLAVRGLLGLAGANARARALAVVLVVSSVVVFGLWNALRGPVIKRVALRVEGWPPALDGYRIAQISDVHIGNLLGGDFARRVTERCNQLAPDLIAITGDLVDGSVRDLAAQVAPFSALQARDGVYFVTGNHDHYSGADGWVNKLTEFGFRVLRNHRVRIERSGQGFELAGVDDYSSRRRNDGTIDDVALALAGRADQAAVVLLAHDPRTFQHAQEHDVRLQLSGHTHAGQMWPFGWLVRLQTPYVRGEYRSGGSALYVSRGTGFWGPPLRVFAAGELTELTLFSGFPKKVQPG